MGLKPITESVEDFCSFQLSYGDMGEWVGLSIQLLALQSTG